MDEMVLEGLTETRKLMILMVALVEYRRNEVEEGVKTVFQRKKEGRMS